MLAAIALPFGSAHAQGWGGALGIGSDNVYRGISLSARRPAWLADLHYGIGTDWTVGLAASQERSPFQAPGAQLTLYLDRRWQLDDDWSAKLGLVHYESPWNIWRNELDYNELNAAIGWRGRWRLSVALSPDSPGVFDYRRPTRIGFAGTAELNYQQPLRGRLGVNAGLGYANRESVAGLHYGYASAGLSYGIGDIYVFSSLLWTTPGALVYDTPTSDRARWVTTLLWSF